MKEMKWVHLRVFSEYGCFPEQSEQTVVQGVYGDADVKVVVIQMRVDVFHILDSSTFLSIDCAW